MLSQGTKRSPVSKDSDDRVLFSKQPHKISSYLPMRITQNINIFASPIPEDLDKQVKKRENYFKYSYKKKFQYIGGDLLLFLYRNFIIQRMKGLRSLVVNFMEAYFYTQEGKRWLNPKLGTALRSVQSLTIVFDKVSHIHDSHLSKFGSYLAKNLKDLKYLTLQFRGLFTIHEGIIEKLCSLIARKLKRLECLTLNISLCFPSVPDPKLFKTITHYLTHYLPRLQSFNLCVPRIYGNGVKQLNFNRQFLQRIQNLEFYLDGRCNRFSNTSKEISFNYLDPYQEANKLAFYAVSTDYRNDNFLGGFGQLPMWNIPQILESGNLFGPKLFSHLLNLKKLELYFDSLSFLQVDGVQYPLESFVTCLNELIIPKLETLKIKISNCQDLDGYFIKLLKCSHANNLRELEISLKTKLALELNELSEKEKNGEKERFLDQFCNNFLKELKNLCSLNIELSNGIFYDSCVNDLGMTIATSMRNLESLKLIFFWIPTLTNDLFPKFQDSFANCSLTHLKNVYITFSNCELLKEEPVNQLYSILDNSFPDLETLDVHFISYDAGSDSTWSYDEEWIEDESDDESEGEVFDEAEFDYPSDWEGGPRENENEIES